jgi:hypothetical protein
MDDVINSIYIVNLAKTKKLPVIWRDLEEASTYFQSELKVSQIKVIFQES